MDLRGPEVDRLAAERLELASAETGVEGGRPRRPLGRRQGVDQGPGLGRRGDRDPLLPGQQGLSKIPAEVHLDANDLVLVVESQDLCVAPTPTAGNVTFVGHDHFIAGFDQPNDLEVLVPPRPRPAALEITGWVERRVRWGGELEVVGQALLEKQPIPPANAV